MTLAYAGRFGIPDAVVPVRETQRAVGRRTGIITFPLVGVLLLGVFALATVLLPIQTPGGVTAILVGEQERTDEPSPSIAPKESVEEPTVSDPVTATVLFPHDQSRLTPQAIAGLDDFVAATVEAAAEGGARIQVEGFGDSTGSDQVNDQVTLARAERVESYLRTALPVEGADGVESVDYVVKGHGARKPVGDNDTEEGRAKNRRVELVAEFSLPGEADSPATEAAASPGPVEEDKKS
ncbi:OmpA family protein [Nocardiopsis ansamitocini]|uniref:OmpA-like domain-containing protein n=1 Tax=Nocardiopsis ansamitocini TaxID=1670832 RepID=A0A9W6UHL9_9ACTN|nr:OmpA family protein [Nocardiopsis ansamitocini]GLU46503.1 hypothetical protein Nans01_08540 [Nocardiopsis ansamitocini]